MIVECRYGCVMIVECRNRLPFSHEELVMMTNCACVAFPEEERLEEFPNLVVSPVFAENVYMVFCARDVEE